MNRFQWAANDYFDRDELELGYRVLVAMNSESAPNMPFFRQAVIVNRCRMAHLWGVLKASRKAL